MKTKLLHSYSSNSLANLSRSNSATNVSESLEKDHGQYNLTFINEDEGTNSTDINVSNAENQVAPSELVGRFCENIFRKKILYKRIPFLKWIQEYNTTKLVADIASGITTGLILIPQGLAYAKLAGLPPQYGLFSGFVGPFIYILFGGSKIITVGPTAILGVITLAYASQKPPEYTVTLCFLTGSVTLFMGIFQLGFITNFISSSVISAFSSAAALTIAATQIKPLLGLSFKADDFREILIGTYQRIDEIRYEDALLSLACILVLLFMQNLQKMFKCCTKNSPRADKFLWFVGTSRSVLVILVCTVIFSSIDPDLFPIGVVGDIDPGLPPFALPPFTLYMNSSSSGTVEPVSAMRLIMDRDLSALIVKEPLINCLFLCISQFQIIPLLALIEHITAAKKFAGTSMLDGSQEMISIGLANIIGSFFSSMPVTGSFSRSTVNAVSGAQSPLGGIVTGGVVLLALQFLTPYFYHIPNASLAAVIMTAILFTVDFGIILEMWKSKKMDLIPYFATFLLSLCGSLQLGIICGICISVTYVLFYAARPAVKIQKAESRFGTEFVIIGLDRSVLFTSVEYIRYMVRKSASTWANDTLPVVIDCHHIQFADFSAAQGIRDLVTYFNEKNQPLILWRTKPSIIRILKGLMDMTPNVPFKYCMSSEELEKIVDGDDGPIEFIVSPPHSPTPSPSPEASHHQVHVETLGVYT